MYSAPLPNRVWTGFALMCGAALIHALAIVLAGNLAAPPRFDLSARDVSNTANVIAAFWSIELIVGLLGVVLTIAGFIDYARAGRPPSDGPRHTTAR